MKKLFACFFSAMMIFAVGCERFDDSPIWEKLNEYGESIRDHEQRISALEELCKQMNTNIEALQALVAALEQRDYVTHVSEVRSNGRVVGYTISFGKSDTITIYHGQDGQDGADGKDGYTPQIGVMKDTDGIYYWTLDGEWLLDAKGNKMKAVGTDGKDGKDGINGTDGQNGSDGIDGSDGTNGTDGKDGKDGKDGITPQLKIENDYWYVSYDNGTTWVQLGKATGEDGKDGSDGEDGSDGADGEDGDSIFKSVTQDDEYVYFNLSDGTMITLPKHDKENIQFEDLQVKAICCQNWDTNNDGELSYAEAAVVETIGTVFCNKRIIAFTELKYFTGIKTVNFSDCSALWKIVLPENLLSVGSFSGCTSLKSITIPDSVTEIGYQAFSGCSGLTSVTIGTSVSEIGTQAFYGCTGELIINSQTLAGKDYTISYYPKVNQGWLSGSNFTKLKIGKNVTTIGCYTFYKCSSLTSVTIGNSVTKIGTYAFNSCSSLTSVTIGNSVTSIDGWVFEDCTSLTSVTIPDSVTSIGSGVFSGCTSLTSMAIPDSVTSIGNYAFQDCTSLTSVTIPDSVTSIGDCAFYDCIGLTSVTIPDSVTEIGGSAFYGCRGLTSVYIKSTTPPAGGWGMFSYDASGSARPIGCLIYVPRNSVDYYKAASYWNDYASSIVGYDF